MSRRIVYLTGTRADFGLMERTLRCVAATPGLSLSLIVTGQHLSEAHGHTVDEVRASGLPVAAELPLDLQTRTGASMALGIADCLRGATEVLQREKPHLLLLLGDRGEMLAGAIAALHLGIPCVHLHGGERSGTVDEPVRHAISKLSTWHLVATPDARDRLQRMGEEPSRIHVVGAPGLDGLRELAIEDRSQGLRALGLPASSPFLLALFHPVVQQAGAAAAQTAALQATLARVGLPVLWLDPNADAGSKEILSTLQAGALPPGSRRATHLPRSHYVTALRHCDALVGNSSSGIIEAASFGTPVVNVGDRQRLRLHGPNVVDVPAAADAIEEALRSQLSHGRWPWENPWGDGASAPRIASLLASLPLDPRLLEKTNTD
ncbi:MAG: UDP-N-acetylglucosamine 2-epimerase (hydrolyzing) [Comamonadaceae bacterium]|nr:MAG: UDP-N-acetylglucosamine 2-epimerase (hydrolyzing) [Comamonadaceae bacterium]